ncbi:transcriptional regulator [Ktedonobacter sp. SOSP1-85]|uniref:MerR family transcriptional regulator n=1 Tax=Ktedonobacter sp. SOSP1-85 TaxID=2778367 RepID=UPI0019161860|nr:MerR family transcriptional regulator [Ktedonobacter sp. SOSP1-85]GHO80164.1 transcriptional regulator [Ktedonobacter sp. SOSP1-85]
MKTLTDTEEKLTIQEVARRSGLAESTLRYYEKIGLIAPIERDRSSKHRRYSPMTAEVIEVLACLRGAGMGIADMRRYLENMKRGKNAAGDQRALFERHSDRVKEQIDALQKQQAYLDAKVMLWSAREQSDTSQEMDAIKMLQQMAKELRDNGDI